MSDEKTLGIKGSQVDAATTATFARAGHKTKVKQVLPWVAGVLIAAALLVWWTSGASTTNSATAGGDDNVSIWWLALAVLAIMGAFGKGGKGGKWGLFLLASVATFFIVREIFWAHEYGSHAKEVVAIQQQQEAAEEIAELNEDSAASGSWVGRKTAITLTPEWSKAVQVTGGECIRWWGSDPDGNSFLVQVRGVNDNAWYEWEEWKRLRSSGQITHNFGWVRFKATGAVAVVTYEFRQVGQCS